MQPLLPLGHRSENLAALSRGCQQELHRLDAHPVLTRDRPVVLGHPEIEG